MISKLADLAVTRSRRILIVSGIVFLVAAAIGAPVVSILKSENSDFQDPASQNQQVLKAIEYATGQTATYGVVALVPSAPAPIGDRRDSRSASTPMWPPSARAPVSPLCCRSSPAPSARSTMRPRTCRSWSHATGACHYRPGGVRQPRRLDPRGRTRARPSGRQRGALRRQRRRIR